MRLLVAASIVALALTGCANADRAWANCIDAHAPGFQLEGMDEVAALAAAAEVCQADRDADPARFDEVWDF